jgi:putative hydrolase of the HAD superfamily
VLPSTDHAAENGPYDVVLFDMGFTLAYFEPNQRLIVQDALRSAGAERSEVEIAKAMEVVAREYYRDAATVTFPATEEYDRQSNLRFGQGMLNELGQGGDGDSLQVFAKLIDASFSHPDTLRTYPEVISVVTALQQKPVRMGIVSNWSWNLTERVAQVGLDAFFEVIWASAYAGCNKPHPAIFRQAMDRMGLVDERVLYVGDSYEHDVIGARNAGLDVVLVDRDGSSSASGVPIINDLRGLFDHVEGAEEVVGSGV